MNTAIYEGDVLEHALNFGLQSAANRYGYELERVRLLVQDFAKQVYLPAPPCFCQASAHKAMCFVCEYVIHPHRQRISLDS